jgi:membrane fusion protein (multidrug efflux system)
VRLIGASRGQVVLVPEGAIVPRGTNSVVFTVQDGRATEKKVRLGRRAAGEVEILEGLGADATVVTAGQQRVRDGEAVEVVQPQQQPS